MKVEASLTDVNCQLGLVPALTVVQDNMCEFFKQIDCDGLSMVPKCNCFFVLTKTKILFHRFLNWLDLFSVKTEFSSIGKVKLGLSAVVSDSVGLVAECVQEMCAMDASSRSLRVIGSTALPEDIEATKTTEIRFQKLVDDCVESDFVREVIVNLSHLDFYKHVNNVEYVRLMLSTLPLEFFEDLKIKEFEIHYISECVSGDVLRLYTRVGNGRVVFWIKREDIVICKGVLTF